MICKTLQKVIDENLTTAREIGDLTGKAPSTVYRWIRGQSEPDFNTVRLLVRHLPNRRAAESILSAFTAGTTWRFYNLEAELDVNADGVIDVNDALDTSIEAVRGAGKALGKVREASKDNIIDKDECIELIGLLNDVIRQCSVTQQILVHMSEERRKRKIRLPK